MAGSSIVIQMSGRFLDEVDEELVPDEVLDIYRQDPGFELASLAN